MLAVLFLLFYLLWFAIRELLMFIMKFFDSFFDLMAPKFFTKEDMEKIKEMSRVTIRRNQRRASIEEMCKDIPFGKHRRAAMRTIVECSCYGDVVVSRLNGDILEFPPNMPCLTPFSPMECSNEEADVSNLLQLLCGVAPVDEKGISFY